MLVYDVTDYTGNKTRHLAVNKEAAIYDLLGYPLLSGRSNEL